MGIIISIVNQKGGVGKTTTAVNLTAALKQDGKKVLLCDFDPQANATSGMGVAKNGIRLSSYDIIINDADPKNAVVSTEYGDVIPSSAALSGAGVELVSLEKREYRLKQALNKVRDGYDYILVDCPPSLELLTLNALCAAGKIMIPVQCEYYALEGLRDLMTTLRAVKRAMNPKLEISGVLLTMFDGRTNLAVQVSEEVRRFFPEKVYSTVIPRNIRLSEAPSHGIPVLAYDKYSKGAESYRSLAAEILKKEGI